MGEDQEPDLDDLLSGSEDEAENVQELLGVDDMEMPEANGDSELSQSRVDQMEIDGLERFNTQDSSDSEDEEDKMEKERKKQEEGEKRRQAMYERLSVVTPGINLFNVTDKVGSVMTSSSNGSLPDQRHQRFPLLLRLIAQPGERLRLQPESQAVGAWIYWTTAR